MNQALNQSMTEPQAATPEAAQGEVLLQRQGEVLIVTLARAAKLNALTPFMLERLDAVATVLEDERQARVVLLRAQGERAFCVGADVNAWAALAPLDMWRLWTRRGHRVFERWARLRLPVIAELRGLVLGGGLELALVADVRLTESSAQFALPEASIATCPGWSGSQRLVRLVGASWAKYLALSGERLNADTARQMGLVHEVHAAPALAARALELAQRMAQLAPVSLQLSKQLIHAASGEDRDATLEGMASAVAAGTDDAREGLAAFRAKRPADFRGE